MGPWRDVYERDWRAFASCALSDAFGDAQAARDALTVSLDDRAYVAALLGSLGVRDHVPPQPPPSISLSSALRSDAARSDDNGADDTLPLDELLSGADASASYVYTTPRKQRRASSGQFFPQFSAQDFLLDARRESASQTLRLRMADVSPIAPVNKDAARPYYRDHELLFADAGSPGLLGSAPTTPRTGSPSSPSVPESLDAALLRSGDEEFQTPRPSARSQQAGGGLRERRSALRELSRHESRVGDLDVSMHSMNLSDDGFMIVNNPDDDDGGDNAGAHDAARSEHSRSAPYAEDREAGGVAPARESHDPVPKVLHFSSDSEDEEMDFEFGDDEPGDDEPGGDDGDDRGEAMDLTYDDPDGDREASSFEVVEIKAEPESEDVVLLGVVPAPAMLPAAMPECESRPNVVNASRESCDSIDSNQGPVQYQRRRRVFQTRLPLEIEYRHAAADRRRRTQRRKSLLMKENGSYREPEFRAELAPYQQRASLKESRRECQREAAAAAGTSIPRIKPPTLIITPLSILGQWAAELRQKTNLSVITYHGSSRKAYRTAMEFMGADVVLSTYDTLRLKECKVGRSTDRIDDDDDDDDDGEAAPNGVRGGAGTGGQSSDEQGEWRTVLRNIAQDKRSFVGSKLHQLAWHRVILDESHLITNASSARARAAYSLQSKRRWCVTGTPIQNSSSDLVSLVGFLGIAHDADAELNAILPHVMLRRLKATVDSASREPILALPAKTEERVELLFASELEEAFYALLHRSTRKQILQYLQGREAQPQFMHVFELLLRLRQTCNSFALVTQDPVAEVRGGGTLLPAEASASMTPGSKNAQLLERVASRYAAQQLRDAAAAVPVPPSTKLLALVAHLKAVRAKSEKALVISQWTGFLDLVAESLAGHNASEPAARGIAFGKLDGRMSARERDQTVAWFQQDRRLDVLLVSLRTGGMGLNLTAASHVFIMEPSWNPSAESQAVDRAHRFGQSRPVRVVRFIMKHTIEERVVELQRKKRALAASLLGDAAAADAGLQAETRLTRAELRQLFTQGASEEEEEAW
ncbi:hypothetical protein PybrP1_002287 [[Pythium] brassicae (nom. inval.)]|nr:hypothetical protein PybrP1_002287 [[Pythium] brassicae (nom. inval.)]